MMPGSKQWESSREAAPTTCPLAQPHFLHGAYLHLPHLYLFSLLLLLCLSQLDLKSSDSKAFVLFLMEF